MTRLKQRVMLDEHDRNRFLLSVCKVAMIAGLVWLFVLNTPANAGPTGFIAMTGSDTLVPFDIETGVPTLPSIDLFPEAISPYDVTIHPFLPEAWVVASGADGLVVVDRDTLNVIARVDLSTPDSFLVDTAFSPEGDLAYISDRNAGHVVLMDVGTHAHSGITVETPNNVSPGWMAVHPSTGDIYLTDWQGGSLVVIDAGDLSVTSTFLGSGFRMRDLVFSPDAETLYIANGVGNDEILFVNVDTLKIIEQVGVGADPWAVDVTPDGQQLFVANQDSGDASVVNTATLVAAPIPLVANAEPRDVDIAADGSAVYVTSGSIDGEDGVFVIDPDSHVVTDTYTVGPDDSFASTLAVAPQSLGDFLFVDGFEN